MASSRPTAITRLSEAPTEGKKNWLIYGGSGDGKTVLAGTAPKSLFITTEAAGTESAKAFGSTADEWVCDTWEDVQAAHRWLREGGASEYDWVNVDSLSEMEELCWKDQLETAQKSNSSRSIYQAAIQDYAIVDNKVKALVDAFNRLPINVLYTAQIMNLEMTDSDGDEYIKRLPLIGRTKGGAPLSNKICGKVTLVGLLTVRKDESDPDESFRRLYLEAGDQWVAKDRHDTFGRFLDRPDIGEMVEAVERRQKQDAAQAQEAKAAKKKKAAKKAADTTTKEESF